MSWLFCCGDQKQKQLELRNTLDLSVPIPSSRLDKNGANNFEIDEFSGLQGGDDDLEALAGFEDSKSKQLKEILSQKNHRTANEENDKVYDRFEESGKLSINDLKIKEDARLSYQQQSKRISQNNAGISGNKHMISNDNQLANLNNNQILQNQSHFENPQKNNASKNNKSLLPQQTQTFDQRIVNEKKLNSYLQQAHKMIHKPNKGLTITDESSPSNFQMESPKNIQIQSAKNQSNGSSKFVTGTSIDTSQGPSPKSYVKTNQRVTLDRNKIEEIEQDSISVLKKNLGKSHNKQTGSTTHHQYHQQNSGLLRSRKQSESQQNLQIQNKLNQQDNNKKKKQTLTLQSENAQQIHEDVSNGLKLKISDDLQLLDDSQIMKSEESITKTSNQRESLPSIDQQSYNRAGLNQPKSAKNANKQEINLNQNKQNYTSKDKPNKAQQLNNGQNLKINTKNKKAFGKVGLQTSRVSRNVNKQKEIDNSNIKEQKNYEFNSTMNIKADSKFSSIRNIDISLAAAKQNLTAEYIEKDLNQSQESQSKEIFPSLQSEFSFQPKYFKPHAAHKVINLTQDISVNSATLPKSRFFESHVSSDKHKSKQNQAENNYTAGLGKVDNQFVPKTNSYIDGTLKNSLQTTPGYSASSTILPNTRNPSIVPNPIQPSYVVGQQLSARDNKQAQPFNPYHTLTPNKTPSQFFAVSTFNEDLNIEKQGSLTIKIEEDFE